MLLAEPKVMRRRSFAPHLFEWGEVEKLRANITSRLDILAELMMLPQRLCSCLLALAMMVLAVPRAIAQSPLLTLTGTVDGGQLEISRSDLDALEWREIATSTTVTDGKLLFRGVLMRDILARAGARGDLVSARALNDLVVDIPVSDFHDFDVIAALYMDASPSRLQTGKADLRRQPAVSQRRRRCPVAGSWFTPHDGARASAWGGFGGERCDRNPRAHRSRPSCGRCRWRGTMHDRSADTG